MLKIVVSPSSGDGAEAALSTMYVSAFIPYKSTPPATDLLSFQDLGNTNYSIHLPRTAFDRNETAKIVVAAVRSLGVDAYANERNDICAHGFKICRLSLLGHIESMYLSRGSLSISHLSGSAYKIVNNRAYHHGTMLISTQLDSLKGLLHTTKVSGIPLALAGSYAAETLRDVLFHLGPRSVKRTSV